MLYAVHYPKNNAEEKLLEAMLEFREFVRNYGKTTLTEVFRNEKEGTIVAVSVWDSERDFRSIWSEIAKHAPPETWESKPRKLHLMNSV